MLFFYNFILLQHITNFPSKYSDFNQEMESKPSNTVLWTPRPVQVTINYMNILTEMAFKVEWPHAAVKGAPEFDWGHADLRHSNRLTSKTKQQTVSI